MEESKRKIQFKNSGLQIQAIWKIYQEIEKKKPDTSPITEESPEIPELGVLLDGLCGADTLVSHVSGEALLNLVQNGILHYARALNMLLAATPSVVSVTATVRTLHQLLVTEALATISCTGSYKCPYGLRSRPHPMISLLTHRPEGWHTLAQEVAATFAHPDSRVRALGLELVRPVVAFLLTEPQTGDIYCDARRGIIRVLLSQMRPETTDLSTGQKLDTDRGDEQSQARPIEVAALLLKLLPQAPTLSQTQLIFASELMEELCRAVRLHHPAQPEARAGTELPGQTPSSPSSLSPRSGWSQLSAQVFTMGLELVLECASAGVAFKCLALELASVAQACSRSAMAHFDINLIMLGEILDCPLAFEYPEMISLVENAVRVCPMGANILCMTSLLKPLLQILATPKVTTGLRGQGQVKIKAGETLMMIQQRLKSGDVEHGQAPAFPTAFQLLGSIGQKCLLVRDLCLSLINTRLRKTKFESQSTQPETVWKNLSEREIEAGLLQWTRNVKRSLEQRRRVGRCVSSSRLARLAAALLLLAPSKALTRGASGLVLQLARLEPSKALDFIPVVLYSLGKDPSPECRLVLLETLPDLATHKYCVSPVLKILLALGQSPFTRALSVRLVTRLWRQQDRCFPQLLRVLTDPGDGQEASDVLLAKAAAILEICKLKPEKHGAELLAPLSHILEVSSEVQGTAASIILVDSLYLLCKAEVMDLLSLWKVLGPRLGQEHRSRPLVAVRVCRLLSLVPELTMDTDEYQVFSGGIVRTLWQYTQHSSPCVKCSAFQALASFPAEQTRVSYLPDQVTTDLQRQADLAGDEQKTRGDNAEAQEEKEGNTKPVTIDELYPEVPAFCYTALLTCGICRDEETLKGFQVFLQAMIARETANLPRGVYFSSTRKQAQAARSQAGVAVEKIPAFLQQQHHKCKDLGLRSSLAVGLLFCFDPPVETSRDGRQFVVRHSKMFMQMFTSLLQEVQIQASNWHLSSQLPIAWSKFMQRLFIAVLEGRRAQLDFQGKQGNLPAADVAKELSLAWIWSRDAIVDVIRVSSGGSPHAQANSVLALAGLALHIHYFAVDLDPASLEAVEGTSKFMGHVRWMAVACDTVLSLVDVEYKPLAGLLGLCRQLSTLDRAPASPTCSAVARGAVCLLVPILMAKPGRGGTDTLQQLLVDFSSFLNVSPGGDRGEATGADARESSPQVALWNGLSLGLLLGRLFEEHFSQSTGSKGMLAVWRALTALEKECLSSPISDAACELSVARRTGCFLGLASAFCGMCSEGRTESRVHAVSTLEKLEHTLLNTPQDTLVYEVLWFSVAKVSASAHASNTNVQDLISPVWTKLLDTHQKCPNRVGVNLSVGLVASTMSKLGNRQIAETMSEMIDQWLKNITGEESSTQCKLSSACGLMAMLGSEQICLKVNTMTTASVPKVSEVIKAISSIVSSSEDQELQHLSAWMLGHLHLSLSSDPGSKSTVPPSYSYLPDSSFLRASVDFLLEAGRAGSDTILPNQTVTVLQSCNVGHSLPPLDWAGLLLPLMRVNHCELVRTLSLQLAASQMRESPSASTFMSGWLTPPLFHSLAMSTQAALHRCLPEIIRSTSPGILKLYVERSCQAAFTDLTFSFTQAETPAFHNGLAARKFSSVDSHAKFDETSVQRLDYEATPHNVVMSILTGLRDALAIEDPPESVTMILYEATGRFYQLLPLDAAGAYSHQYMALLWAMSECLALVPDEILDSILVNDFVDATTQLKGSFIRCSLVASGRQPISLLNVMVDAAFNVPEWNHAMGTGLLANCLANMHQDDTAGQRTCHQWLVELLGHTNSIASGAWPLADSAPALSEVTHHLMNVVACVFLVFTSPDHDDLALWGLDFQFFKRIYKQQTQDKNESPAIIEKNFSQDGDNHDLPQFDMKTENMLNYLPLSVHALTTKKWEQVLPKFFDWLLSVLSLDHTESNEKDALQGALMSLRHTQQFRQASVWTKAVQF